MTFRDVVASALAVAGVAVVAVATAFLTGSAWWGALVVGVAALLAGVGLTLAPPDVVVTPADRPEVRPGGLGPVEESRLVERYPAPRPIGQPPPRVAEVSQSTPRRRRRRVTT